MKNTNAKLISLILIVFIFVALIPFQTTGSVYASDQQIQLTEEELETYKQELSSEMAKLTDIINELNSLESEYSDPDVAAHQDQAEDYTSKARSLNDEIKSNYDQISGSYTKLIDSGLDVFEEKTALDSSYESYIKGEITASDYNTAISISISDTVNHIDSAIDILGASASALIYIPGKNIKMSKVQDKFEIYGYSDSKDNEHVVVRKRNGNLWDVTANKKISETEEEPTGFVIKNNKLYYSYKKSNGKYKYIKLLSGVKMLLEGEDGYTGLHTSHVYVIKTNGDLMKGVIKDDMPSASSSISYQKNYDYDNIKIIKNSWTKITGNLKDVKEAYVVNAKGDNSGSNINYFVLKNNGSLYAWGRNRYGDVGNGTTKSVSEPTRIMKNVDSFRIVSSYNDQGDPNSVNYFAINKSGSLYAWGRNKNGEVGNGTTKKKTKPYLILKKVNRFEIFDQDDRPFGKAYCKSFFAIKENGELYGWGEPVGLAALPGNTIADTRKPFKMLSNVYMIKQGRDFAFCHNMIALTNDGVLWTWGTRPGSMQSKSNYAGTDGMSSEISWEWYNEIKKVSSNVIAAETNGLTLFYVNSDHVLWYQGEGPGTSYKDSQDKSVKLATKVNAVKTLMVDSYRSTFILKTDGSLYGTNYYYKKYYGKLHKLGTGFPK